MFAPGPGIDLTPIFISTTVALFLAYLAEKYLSVRFSVNILRLKNYPDNGIILALMFNVSAIIVSFLSVFLVHKYMNFKTEIPVLNIKLNDALTGALVICAWLLPRYIYHVTSLNLHSVKEYMKLAFAIIFNTLLIFISFAICLIIMGNVYRILKI